MLVVMASRRAEIHKIRTLRDARIWDNVDVRQADTIDSPRALGPQQLEGLSTSLNVNLP